MIQRFELTFLTESQVISVRKLRSFCASLGGTGQILSSYDDFKRQDELQAPKNLKHIIIYDTQLKFNAQQLNTLRKSGILIVLDTSTETLPVSSQQAALWENDHYCSSSIEPFFDSPVVRVSLSRHIIEGQPFHLSNLMRWGHSSQIWLPESGLSMSDLSQGFTRSLKLNGERRRLIEMANHLIVTAVPRYNLQLNSLTFASDGIITGIIAHLGLGQQTRLPSLVEEITLMEFPVGVIVRLNETSIELGAMVFNHHIQPITAQRMFLNLGVNTKSDDLYELSTLNKAG